jgi:hypothetical protein
MSYIPSINIEQNTADQFQYIVTENAKLVLANIINGFNSGHHSFTVIGTYGTGKSSFIVALENDLINDAKVLIKNKSIFGETAGFEFLNIVGDYSSLARLISEKLNAEYDNAIDALHAYYNSLRKQNKFLFIVIDEFGKILEHAANKNPEKELYFLQKLAEFVNVPTRNIILLTTLHQNFGSYAAKLTEQQRNEWLKVKGRFKEVVFAEPVEQLLYLTAKQLDRKQHIEGSAFGLKQIFELARKSNLISDSFKFETAQQLFPLDPVSATCLTIAVQRYGQNERSLFSFLSAKGADSINDYTGTTRSTYNVARVYDYLKYHFYTALTETNADSMGWRALAVAVERVENSQLTTDEINSALKIVKTIGILNMFFSGISLDSDFLKTYCEFALDIANGIDIISKLVSLKIIRFASYKSQYILFEGTNIDIESEIYKASAIVPTPTLTIDEIAPYIKQRVSIANASYYNTGTPRYFEFKVSNEPLTGEGLSGDIDGIVDIIFPLADNIREVIELSKQSKNRACIYAYFRDADAVVKRLHEIKKLQYIIDNIAFDDRVAKAELMNQKEFEAQKLNEVISSSLYSSNGNIIWINDGSELIVNSSRQFNALLSSICDKVYCKTPIIRNELINRQKLSSAISLARVNLLDAMLNHSDEKDFGFAENAFPPEKTIYYTLFRNSGIHRQDNSGNYILGEPQSSELQSLWLACANFVKQSTDKPRKLQELVDILKAAPFKLKQGVIDFWIPIFLYVNQQDFALYNGNTFVLNINKEVFELIQKRLKDFSIRAFNVSGVKFEFFNKYRQFLNKEQASAITANSFIETVKPFFRFYRSLNNYAKITRKFDNPFTAKFRDVLSNAKDPSVTFFEELPAALGYTDLNSTEFVEQYIGLIKTAVRDLNRCYDLFIDRLENSIVDRFGFPTQFEEYKQVIESRYHSIDASVLPPKSKAFLERLLSPSSTRKEFFEKLAIVITDKRLDETKDNEEALLTRNMLHIFSELERYSSLGSIDSNSEEEAFNVELAYSKGKYAKAQTFIVPKNKVNEVNRIKDKITTLLSGDNDLDVCVLLKMLNERLK